MRRLTGQRKRTYDSIRKAYKELLREKPHDAITATEIAKRANINRTTFYQYYADSGDVFFDLHYSLLQKIAGQPLTLDELLAKEPPKHMIEKYQYVLLNKRARNLLIVHPASRPFVEGFIAKNLQNSLASTKEDSSQKGFQVFIDYMANYEVSTLSWWLDEKRFLSWPLMSLRYGKPSSYLDPQYVAGLSHQYRREIITKVLFPLLGRDIPE